MKVKIKMMINKNQSEFKMMKIKSQKINCYSSSRIRKKMINYKKIKSNNKVEFKQKKKYKNNLNKMSKAK